MNGMRRDELKRKVCDCMVRGEDAAVGCPSLGDGTIGGEYYRGNLLWQSSLVLLFSGHWHTSEHNRLVVGRVADPFGIRKRML